MEGITQDTCCVSEDKESYSTSRLVGKPAIAPFSRKLVRPEAEDEAEDEAAARGESGAEYKRAGPLSDLLHVCPPTQKNCDFAHAC